MKLLTKSQVGKLNKTSAKVEFMQDKLTVEPLSGGKGRLDFPVPFSCYKFINVDLSAKKSGLEDGVAKIGVSFIRRGVAFGPKEGEKGFIEISGEGYKHYKLHFLIPFGVDEAYVTIILSGGASIQLIDLDVSVDFAIKKDEGAGIRCFANGGLSGYAPKNSMSAILASLKAGYSHVVVDADQTSDGEIVALDGANLSAYSDGDGYSTDYTYEELCALDFGFFADKFYKNTQVVKLADAIKAIANAKASPIIRISVRNFDFDKLEEILEPYSFVDGLTVISPDMSTLEKASAYFPDAKFGYESDELTLDRCERLANMNSFVISDERPKNMAKAEELGARLVLIANDEKALERARAEGAYAIITEIYQLDGCKF